MVEWGLLADVSAASLPLHAALVTVGIPFAIAALGGVLAALTPARFARTRTIVPGAALGVALVAAYVGTGGRVPWPPLDASGWLPYAVMLAAAMWALADAAPFPVLAAVALRVALFGGLSWLLLREPARYADWSLASWGRWAALPALAAAAAWTLTAPLCRRGRAVVLPTAFACAFAAASALVLLHESARVAQWLGGCAASCAALVLVLWVQPRLRFGESALAVAMTSLGGALIYAHYYVDIPPHEAALVLAAVPFAGYLARVFTREGRRDLAIILLCMAFVETAAGPAVLWAWQRKQAAATTGNEDAWGDDTEETLYGY